MCVAVQHNQKPSEPSVTIGNVVKEDTDSSKHVLATDMTPSPTPPSSPLVIPEIRINESPLSVPAASSQQQPPPSLSERKPHRPTKLNIPNPIRPASEAFSEDSTGTAEKLYKEALEQG